MFVLCKLLCGELAQVFSMLFLELSIYAICADVIFINKWGQWRKYVEFRQEGGSTILGRCLP